MLAELSRHLPKLCFFLSSAVRPEPESVFLRRYLSANWSDPVLSTRTAREYLEAVDEQVLAEALLKRLSLTDLQVLLARGSRGISALRLPDELLDGYLAQYDSQTERLPTRANLVRSATMSVAPILRQSTETEARGEVP